MDLNRVYAPKVYENSELSGICGIYQIRNIVNGKLYIGSAVNLLYRKYDGHFRKLRNGKHHNEHLQNAFNTYGEENFIFEVIEFCEPENKYEIEQYWIDRLDVLNKDNGYNIRPKADGTLMSEETKRKLSKSRKEGIASGRIKVRKGFKNSEITRKRISKSRLGIEPWNKGKIGIYSEESLKKMSETRKNKIKSGEIEVRRGFRLSDETRKKLSQNHADVNREKNPMYGVHRYGLDAPTKVKVVRLSDNKIYDLVKFCAEDNNLARTTITNHCKNRAKTIPQKFMYYEDWIKLKKDS